MVIVDGAGAQAGPGHPGAERIDVPGDVRVVTGAELEAGRRAWLFEEVAGVRLRVSARSFFQAGPEAAEALVAEVAAALGEGPRGSLADLYGGVGLFAATAGGAYARVTVVESSPSACADARVNLASRAARVNHGDVRRWRPRRVDAVVADPPGRGWAGPAPGSWPGPGPGGWRWCRATRPPSGGTRRCCGRTGSTWRGCDAGRRLPHTPHVEVVSRFARGHGS